MKTWIPFWSRKEIFISRDTCEMNNIRDLLFVNDISHIVKTNSMTNPGRYHSVLNMKSDFMYEYRIYVHKDNYERTKMLLKKSKFEYNI